MKFLLVAINAKYIHSNLGVYSLKAYADQWMERSEQGRGEDGFLPSVIGHVDIEIGEYTIKHQMDRILEDIYKRQPSAIGFSCYIWNIEYVMDLVRDVRKIMPQVDIWLGGPEVSYDAVTLLEKELAVDGIMMGEGEETFAKLMECYRDDNIKDIHCLQTMDGLAFRDEKGMVRKNNIRPVMDMSQIPFAYGELEGFQNRIIYYESSRGCPYSCSYCLSSIDKSVRFRDLDLVKKELQFFLDHQIPQVKFVDRTFNCKKHHAMEIWQYLLDHDNGITNFHFEISADLLDEDELALIKQMRPGLIQLEIGVQTTNPETIKAIHRSMDLTALADVVKTINEFNNVHQHLDLIAGLPYEDYDSFKRSFDAVYAMRPEQLQLGFLKVLKGSYMKDCGKQYELTYKGKPPYEVLSTKWLSYGDILALKAVEEMVEVYYNSGQFRTTMALLEQEFSSAFEMFEALAKEYEVQQLFGISHNRLARYEILYRCIQKWKPDKQEEYRDCLMYDLYLRENVKSRPSFARDQMPYKVQVRDFFISEAREPKYLFGYEAYDSKQMSKMAHIEVMGDERFVLFDYLNRDPLNYNAKATQIDLP